MFPSFLRLLIRCYRMALPYGRWRLFGVLGLILCNGALQLVGVTSVFPFFALAADPNRLRRSSFGSWLLHHLPPMDANRLLVAAGCFAIGMLVLASVGSMVSEVIRIRYAFGFCHWLRCRLFESYAGQPYAFFLRRNSTDLNQKLWDVQQFIQSVLLPVGEFLTRLVLVLLLVGAVFLVQPWVALLATLVFGGYYLMVFIWLRSRARTVNTGLQRHNVGFGKEAYQFLHGIKAVLVHGKSRHFMNRALDHSLRLGDLHSRVLLYGNGPRYLIEPVAFGSLVAIVVAMALRGRPFTDILPNLAVLALAGYRLLPALQLLYSQLVSVATNQYTLKQLEDEIVAIEEETEIPPAPVSSAGALAFERELRLDQITFRYPAATAPVLENISLTVAKNGSVGIAGPTGSGKSTLVDLILGLHRPQAGVVSVDGVPLTGRNLGTWRRMIGYVPQDIYLLDETVEANIAFGVEPGEVDPKALREAAQGAQILEFIERELPGGFATIVGERGVRLSGGQRQRIGLARALYHRPQVLILDEATSALDLATEAEVMRAIDALRGQLTLIVVAHRISTIERCDLMVTLPGRKETDHAEPS